MLFNDGIFKRIFCKPRAFWAPLGLSRAPLLGAVGPPLGLPPPKIMDMQLTAQPALPARQPAQRAWQVNTSDYLYSQSIDR